MDTTFSALSSSSDFRIRLRSSAFAFGAFVEALRAAGFLAVVFFLSDLTVTDFVRADRTGDFGASCLLLWLDDWLLAIHEIPSAHPDLEAKCHAIPKPVLPSTAGSRNDSMRAGKASIIWFTA